MKNLTHLAAKLFVITALLFTTILHSQNLECSLLDANKVGRYNSLAIDVDGGVHIAYLDDYNNTLKYAYQKTATWEISTIDGALFPSLTSATISIALDSKGMPHISYRSYSSLDLKYAYKDASGWHITTVDSQGDVGRFSSIAIDYLDIVHIAYYNDTDKDLKYASGNGANFTVQTISSSGDIGGWTSIDIDQNNQPHITCVYRTSGISRNEGTLKYFHYNGMTWVEESLSNVKNRDIYYSKIKIDNLGLQHIAFLLVDELNHTNNNIYYLKKDGLVWSSKIIKSSGGHDETISLALSRTNEPIIAYSYYLGGSYFGYILKKGQTWSETVLDAADKNTYTLDASICLDLYDQVHLSSYDKEASSGSLIFCQPEYNTPTTFSLTVPQNGSWADSYPLLLWKPSCYRGYKLLRYEVFIDGTKIEDVIQPSRCFYKFGKPLSEGWHTWRIKAITSDASEIWSNETWSFRIDVTPPAFFQLAKPINHEWVAVRRPLFSWLPSNDTGSSIDKYQILVDGKIAKDNIRQANSSSIDLDLPDGQRQWLVKAFDIAGNSQDSQQTWTINIDQTSPESFVLLEPANFAETSSSTPVFSWTAAIDRGIGLKNYQLLVSTTSGSFKTFDISKDSTKYSLKIDDKLSHGNHEWYIKAIDRLGNYRESQHQVVSIDLLPPAAFLLIAPTDSSFVSYPTPEFSWNASSDANSGLSHYDLYIDNQLSVSNLHVTKTAPSLPLSEGGHQWFIRAIDKVGNITCSQTRVIFCEWNQPYAFNLLSPEDGVECKVDSLLFRWQASKDTGAGLVKYQLWIDGVLKKDSINPSDTTATPGILTFGEHSWYIIAVDKAGNARSSNSIFKFLLSPSTGISESSNLIIPKEFKIHQNYPNPFNSMTTICYDIPFQSEVDIQIFNLNGQLIKRLVQGTQARGRLQAKWDGKNYSGSLLPSGIYICKMVAPNYVSFIKISYIR